MTDQLKQLSEAATPSSPPSQQIHQLHKGHFTMIHLSHSVSGTQIGTELAGDEEELAYALVAIAESGPDCDELRDFLSGQDQRAVRDLCNEIAIALGDD